MICALNISTVIITTFSSDHAQCPADTQKSGAMATGSTTVKETSASAPGQIMSFQSLVLATFQMFMEKQISRATFKSQSDSVQTTSSMFVMAT